jgi:decaprenyl-phosphate phosphoribosyltransferase
MSALSALVAGSRARTPEGRSGRAAVLLMVAVARSSRPRQWLKNGLVVAAPAAAGALGQGRVLERLVVAFAAFCLAAGATYLINDVRDIEHDRRHPRKRSRPIAAGALPVRLALAAAAVEMAAGLALAAVVSSTLVLVLAGYLALTTVYSVWLRHLAGLDVAAVSGCFLLRAAAGGVAAEVSLSGWFIAVVMLGATFVVLGKRHAECLRLGHAGRRTRTTLGTYRPAALRAAAGAAAAATVVVYALWALAHPQRHLGIAWAEASVLPFTFGVARYIHVLADGGGEFPEHAASTDRLLQASALVWIAVFAFRTYAGG